MKITYAPKEYDSIDVFSKFGFGYLADDPAAERIAEEVRNWLRGELKKAGLPYEIHDVETSNITYALFFLPETGEYFREEILEKDPRVKEIFNRLENMTLEF